MVGCLNCVSVLLIPHLNAKVEIYIPARNIMISLILKEEQIYRVPYSLLKQRLFLKPFYFKSNLILN